MTRPALRPLTAATAALVAGAVGAVPATAAGAPGAPAAAAHRRAPHPQPALSPPRATPAAAGASTVRDPGAPQTGLAAGSVVVAGVGIPGTPAAVHGGGARPSGAPARARAPPR